MIRCAFVIPVYPPHFQYMYSVIGQLLGVVDVFLVFTNEAERKLYTATGHESIVLPENVHREGIINYKKFYALKHVLARREEYTHFIVCDSEIKLVLENFTADNVNSKIEHITRHKRVFGGQVVGDMFGRIISATTNYFQDMNGGDVQAAAKDLYTWWSDIPLYQRDHLNHFFECIKFEKEDITWFHFDHCIYTQYLLRYQGFTVINVTECVNHGFSLEEYDQLPGDKLHILKELGYSFSHASQKTFNAHSDFLIQNGCFLIFHLDRR
jgi:hypothetical protein